jgi:hypothetical protein
MGEMAAKGKPGTRMGGLRQPSWE